MSRMAKVALFRKAFARGDSVFIAGETATHMYVAVEGRLVYMQTSTGSGSENIETVDKGFISEPVLWTPTWIHLGCLAAVTECEILMLGPNEFRDIICRDAAARAITVRYAQEFIEELNS